MKRYELIFETVSGSHLYGTNLPTSDIDYRGVGIEDVQSLLGFHKFEEEVIKDPDRTIFSLRKFLNLALDGNPNILELLFAPTTGDTCIYTTPVWEFIVEHREYFLSQKIRKTFMGYAFAQLKKMETHYKWLNSEPPEKPDPKNYGRYLNDEGNEKWLDHTQFQIYNEKKKLWDNYATWLANRNDVRHELEMKYGFDTKFGSHTIRLLTMGKELLETGYITLPRPDAKELLDIRRGKYSYHNLVQLATELMRQMDGTKGLLPEKPNYDIIEELSMKVHFDFVLEKGLSWD